VLRNVEEVEVGTRILGNASRLPFYCSPMGSMGSIHPDGEIEMTKAIVQTGMHGLMSTSSSKTTEQIMETYLTEHERRSSTGGTASKLMFQLYLPTDHQRSLELIRRVKKAGCFHSLWLTIDTPVLGKRTADRYQQAQEALDVGLAEEDISPAAEQEVASQGGAPPKVSKDIGGRPPPGQLSAHTTWEDLAWIRREWGDRPIVLKGIQTADDARLALQHGVQGILLSNHGGRQMHAAPSALMTLLEIRTYAPEVLGKLEVFVDGGLRDGADVLKALCLGATAVGVGRPFLYALAAYGRRGVERCVDGESFPFRHNGGGALLGLLLTFIHSSIRGAHDRDALAGYHVNGPSPPGYGQCAAPIERDVAAGAGVCAESSIVRECSGLIPLPIYTKSPRVPDTTTLNLLIVQPVK